MRKRDRCPELLFLFKKRMMGALAPFSYLVKYKHFNSVPILPLSDLKIEIALDCERRLF